MSPDTAREFYDLRRENARLKARLETLARKVTRYMEGVRVRGVLRDWPALEPLMKQLEDLASNTARDAIQGPRG